MTISAQDKLFGQKKALCNNQITKTYRVMANFDFQVMHNFFSFLCFVVYDEGSDLLDRYMHNWNSVRSVEDIPILNRRNETLVFEKIKYLC